MGHKRKNESERAGKEKRAKGDGDQPASVDPTAPSQKPDGQAYRRPRIRKLAPPRPFPTVAPASAATGPRSVHHEGKNNICVTRKTKLAAYLRRCKALLVDDGFKELRLSAMGAAIPHLALLAVSLPPLLPWTDDDVHVDVLTGSLEVHDELLSESGSEAEDDLQEEFRTRVKSTMNVVIRIGQDNATSAPDTFTRGPPALAVEPAEVQARGGKDDMRQEKGVPERVVLQE